MFDDVADYRANKNRFYVNFMCGISFFVPDSFFYLRTKKFLARYQVKNADG